MNALKYLLQRGDKTWVTEKFFLVCTYHKRLIVWDLKWTKLGSPKSFFFHSVISNGKKIKTVIHFGSDSHLLV